MRVITDLKILLCVILPFVSGCVATPDYQTITTRDEYLTKVAGRTVNLGDGSSTTHADGTMTGKVGGLPIVGSWTWEDGFFCRQGKVGPEQMERDCQKLEIADDNLRVTRNSGDGPISVFKLK